MPSRLTVAFALAILVLAMAIGSYALLRRGGGGAPVTVGEALVGGPFTMTDHTGRRVTDQDFRGKYMLVFFGYTYCPDVCPTELQVMSAALDSMGAKADRIQPIFVSIDPDRDTPDVLKQYVSNFHPRMVGLTGSPEDVAAMAKAYRVYYRKVEEGAAGAAYLMDHSSILYLMDRDGRFATHFTYTTDAEELAKSLLAATSD